MKFILINIILVTSFLANAQYLPMLSDYYFNNMFLNPAYCGSREVLSSSLFYRDQWRGLKGAPKTTAFNIHSPLKDLNMAMGIAIFNDRIGISEKNDINVNYVYRLRFNEGKRNLAFGLKTGLINHTANLSNLKLIDKNDITFTSSDVKYTKVDIGTGLYYYTRHFYIGLSVPFLFDSPYSENFSYKIENFKNLNKLFYSGIVINLNEEIKMHPSLCIYSRANEQKTIIKFSVIALNTLSIGIAHRYNEATIFSTEYQLNRQWCIGFSHDFINLPFEKIIKSTNEFYLRYELIKTYNAYSTRFF